MVDAVENIDKFIDHSVASSEIFLYYLYSIPWFIQIALPISIIITLIATFGSLESKFEISAMKSLGINLRKISINFMILGMIFSFLSFYYEDYIVIKSLNNKETLSAKIFNKNKPKLSKNIYRVLDKNTIINMKKFDFSKLTANNVTIINKSDDKINSRFDCPKLKWDEKTQNWIGEKYSTQLLNSKFNDYVSSSDTILNLGINPIELTQKTIKPEQMNYAQLLLFDNKLKENGINDPKWSVNLHFKQSFSMSSFILILFGLIISFYSSRNNIAMGIGISIIFIFIYYSLIKIFQSYGINGLISPESSAWIPIVLFTSVGLLFFYKIKT